MISSQVIHKTIEDLHAITKVDFSVYETDGSLVAATWEDAQSISQEAADFAHSQADSQEVQGSHFFKVSDDDTVEYILVARGMGEDVHMMGKVAACQVEALSVAYRERYDRNTFIQNLLLDNLLLVDIYNRAKKLHIEAEVRRLVFVIETRNEKDNTAMEILKMLFGSRMSDFITAVDEKSMIYVRTLADGETEESGEATANLICDMLNTEAMSSVRVAYGTVVDDIQQVSRSYKEARMALEVGRIFYPQKRIHDYRRLGIGRLIYQLPPNLCEMFINEVFTGQKPDELDEETLMTINKFFENSLNVSETARQMFVHRNTLVYRLEKLQKTTGLDVRDFEDAMTFRIALMVTGYMKHMAKENP